MATRQAEQPSTRPGVFSIVLAAAILTAVAVTWLASGSGTSKVTLRTSVTTELSPLKVLASSGGGCVAAPEFIHYVSSTWEAEWLDRAEDFQNDPALGCQTLRNATARSAAWLAVTTPADRQGSSLPERYEDGQATLAADIFSSMLYRSPCSGEEYTAYIEPLVGHFRHPYALPDCKPPGVPKAGIEVRDYVMFGGLSKEQFSRAYPGKKYLFDLGTAKFNSSIPWFQQRLQEYGHAFDEIWAWEVKIQEPKSYWGAVPEKVLDTLHFYNVPVGSKEDSPSNPLNIMRKRYQPGDYIFVKLDIDNSPLELSFIDQIASDPQLISMISEMSFEMHYYSPYMAKWFGKPEKQWIDVIITMTALRQKGLKIHYWP